MTHFLYSVDPYGIQYSVLCSFYFAMDTCCWWGKPKSIYSCQAPGLNPFSEVNYYIFTFKYVLCTMMTMQNIYTFIVSRAFIAGAASQAGDADFSRAPGLTSGLQRSVNVHRGALLLVPQWQCIISVSFLYFTFYFDAVRFLFLIYLTVHVMYRNRTGKWVPWVSASDNWLSVNYLKLQWMLAQLIAMRLSQW